MVAFRALLGPALFLVALNAARPQPWLGAMIAAGFLSDVFDGILARRWGTATAALRIADTVTDLAFYLSLLAATVVRHGPVLRDRIWWVAAVLALEGLHILFDSIKYGRIASYHSYASKLWGVLLVTALIALLCFDRGFWLSTIALAWGVICELEGLAMSILLPEWTHDVKTLRQAVEIRRKMRSREPVPAAG